MSDKEKLIFCIMALQKIAVSYKERIDRADTPPYVFADQILAYIGNEDIVALDYEEIINMFLEFHRWRRQNA